VVLRKVSSSSNSTYSNQEAALALLLGGARLFPLGTLGARVQELVEDRESRYDLSTKLILLSSNRASRIDDQCRIFLRVFDN
jgi:hypothetical protein